MRLAFTGLLIILAASMAPLRALGWPVIPSEVWAIQEDPAKGIRGAVVLEDRMSFKKTYIEYVYRVRVLSEAGRKAAEFNEFPDEAYGFEGRTIYKDGTSVQFSKRKDFQTRTTAVGSEERQRTVIIPPGVTSDCVVELRWLESSAPYAPLPRRMGSSYEWFLGHPFMTRELSIDIPLSFPWAHTLFPSRSHRPVVEEKSGKRVYTFHDLPAVEELPYALKVSRDFPRFVVFEVPDLVRGFLNSKPEDFWKQAVNAYWKDVFVDRPKKGRAYKAFSTQLRTGLPTDPLQLGAELVTRLNGRIQNSDFPTFEEKGKLTKAKAEAEADADAYDLEAMVNLGRADAFGMTQLFVNLLVDAGVTPKVALVADRDKHLFRWEFNNVYQFDAYLIGIEVPTGVIWFEPGLRFAQPGLVHPDYQGVPAMQFDLKDWSVKRVTIPPQSAGFNQKVYQVRLDLDEESDRFQIQAKFNGYPEWSERLRFMPLESKEQERTLKESLEKDLKGAQIEKVSVRGAQDPKVSLAWSVEGSIEREPGRKREVHPFPGMTWAIWVPDEWPVERRDAIIIPYLRSQEAACEFNLPKGYTWSGSEPYAHSNRFGSVKWSADRLENDRVKVQLAVTVNCLVAAPDAYAEFREFMGWVSEASGRYLLLSSNR